MIIEAGVRETSKNGNVRLWDANKNGTAVGAFEVSLDLSPYKILYISVQHAPDNTNVMTTPIVNDASATSQFVYCVDNRTEVGRVVTITSTGLRFSAATKRTYGSDGTITVENGLANAAVPIRIYGSY